VLFDSTTGKLIKAATTTGLLKASTGVIAAAVSGTDYAPATSGSANQLLASNGTGGFTNLTTGTGVVTALGVNTGSSGAFIVNGGALGTPLSGTVTNLTGTASININGTVGATTPSTGAFTTLSATGNVSFDGGTFVFNESGADKDFRIEGDTEPNLFFTDASTDRVGIGTSSPSSILDVQKAGTAASTTDLLELTNSGNAASMTNTGTGILFNQFYYDVTTPAVADAGRIAVKTEGNWTSTATTQDAYMTFEVAVDGTVTERARITSGGDLQIANGNLVISTSGKGIDFSATPGTGTSELLADYEEGTWTPSFTFASGSVTYTTQTGTYTKVGRLVTLSIYIKLATVSSPASYVIIQNPPFTMGSTIRGAGAVYVEALVAGVNNVVCQIRNGNNDLFLQTFANGAVGSLTGYLQANSIIQITASYEV
jgi:hypothetical protein